MKGLRFACLCICFAVLAGCGARESTPSPAAVSSQPSGTPSVSSAPPVSPASNQQAKKLVFSEDDLTSAFYRIGMTREQARQATKENELRLKPNDCGYSEDFIFMLDGGFSTTDGISARFDNETDLLCQVIIFPVSETELYSPYCSQKGFKLGDTVERLIELYGEPDKIYDTKDVYNPLLFYYYKLPIDLDNYNNEIVKLKKKSPSNTEEAYFRVSFSQAEGANFNKATAIAYEAF